MNKDYTGSVRYISSTRDALHLVVAAARRCKDSFHLSDTPSIRAQDPTLFHTDKVGPKDLELVRQCIKEGHESILEHAVMTFEFDISRVTHTQLVRHRMASYSAESARAVDLSKLEKQRFFAPPSLKGLALPFGMSRSAIDMFWASIEASLGNYTMLVKDYGAKPEDARYVLPMALMQPIMMSANLREWRHVLRERTCKDAQFEIRRMAKNVRNAIAAVHDVFTIGTTKMDTCGQGGHCGLCLVNWEGIEAEPSREITNG